MMEQGSCHPLRAACIWPRSISVVVDSEVNTELRTQSQTAWCSRIHTWYESLLDGQPSESKLDWFILGEIGDFSKNTALQQLVLMNNKLTGGLLGILNWGPPIRQNWNWNFAFSGSIPDFSENAALETLDLNNNKLEGEFLSDHHWSGLKITFLCF